MGAPVPDNQGPGSPGSGSPGSGSQAPASGRALAGSLTDDLIAESAALRAVLADLPAADWGRPTPAAGWTVTDQVTHLAYFDDVTRLSLTDPAQFTAEAARLAAGGDDFPDRIAARYHDTPPADALAWYDRARQELAAAYRRADPAVRLPWFGPPMSLASSVTARLMETWAHGQDILDTFGIARVPTARMRHVADLGVRALRYAHAVNGLAVPADPVRVELAGPDGARWTWGPPDAANRVTGTALDFCLLVTQRRHRDDTALEVTGAAARQWVSIAQAFAGPAGPGRPPSPDAAATAPAPAPAPATTLTAPGTAVPPAAAPEAAGPETSAPGAGAPETSAPGTGAPAAGAPGRATRPAEGG